MIDDHRNRIKSAAARVYAKHGWTGATTRRIAEEAGVNEVTIFRQFGTKDALLDIAVRECSRVDASSSLPITPRVPQDELTEWATAHYETIRGLREIFRQIMSDANNRPTALSCADNGQSKALSQLRDYVIRLRRAGFVGTIYPLKPADVGPAVSMLMGALFNDAMNREMMPEFFPQSHKESIRAYVRMFLRGLGASAEPVQQAPRRARRS